jgi:uncharacterized membrane protein
MRSFISKSLEVICQLAIVILLLSGFFGGWQSGGFIGAIGGLIVAFVVSVVFFGALFILLDIAENTRRTAEALEKQQQ